MRAKLIVVLALVILAQGLLAQDFKKSTSMEQYERAMWQAVRDAKWLEVQSHMAETYVASTPLGLMDRAAMLDHFKQIKLASFEISDLESRPNGADMVVTYRLRVRGPDNQEHEMRILTVWQTVKRGWIEIAQSATEMQPQH